MLPRVDLPVDPGCGGISRVRIAKTCHTQSLHAGVFIAAYPLSPCGEIRRGFSAEEVCVRAGVRITMPVNRGG